LELDIEGYWQAVALHGQPIEDDNHPTLLVGSDLSVSGHAGCNRFSGALETTEDGVKFGALGVTRMMCAQAEMGRESAYLDALDRTVTISASGDAMMLHDGNGNELAVLVRMTEDAELSFSVPGARSVERVSRQYECDDGRSVDVDYINAGPVSLALLTFEQEFVATVQVIAASGARYAGGRYVWWSNGEEASFEGLMVSEKDGQVNCVVTQ
jgi:membrane-bound inhibitor of C-type lysozyme/heat shock protein HslJ